MNKKVLLAVAAAIASTSALADTNHAFTKYERVVAGGCKICMAKATDGAGSYSWASVYGPAGSAEALAAADAWAEAFAFVNIWARAEADIAISRSTPIGLVKDVDFNAALTSGIITISLAEGTAEAVGAGDSSAYAVTLVGKKDAAAGGLGAGWASAEGVAGANAFAGSLAGVMSQELAKVHVDSFGLKSFYAGLLMGNIAFAKSDAEVAAVADVATLAKALGVAFTYVRQHGYDKDGAHYSVDLDASKDEAAAFAAANALAKAVAYGNVLVTVKAAYQLGGWGWKSGWDIKTKEFDLTANARVILGCAAYADAEAVADTAVSASTGYQKDPGGRWHKRQ